MASFIKTQRDCQKLLFEGYSYNMIRRGNNGQRYWRCDETSIKCKGFAVSDKADNVKLGTPHTHGLSSTRINVKVIKHNIKEAAAQGNITPRDVVSGAIKGISDSVKTSLPELRNLQKTVCRKRKAIGISPVIPHSLAEVTIPQELCATKTERRENFILGDTGPADPNRIIIFSCTTDINRLTQCKTWVIDGTFKCAPDLWYQLWVIHGVFHEKTVPLVYSLLPNKQQNTYERALEMILNKIDDVRPGTRPTCLNIDFEKAEDNAFKQLIPNVRIHGCFFHFSQSIWRKIKELGLVERYRNDEYFRMIMKSFSALAFVPSQEVITTFGSLADEMTDNFGEEEAYNTFIEYFVMTWVGRQYPRRTPKFDIDMWNCNNITLEGLPRTTNSAESWHHAFAVIFSSHHPNPYKLVGGLLKEQVRVDFICTRLEAGQTMPLYTRVEYRHANERLLALITDFQNRDIGDFLRACSHYVHFTE
jgi:hypothetical protein